jgi:hypothetical protein
MTDNQREARYRAHLDRLLALVEELEEHGHTETTAKMRELIARLRAQPMTVH